MRQTDSLSTYVGRLQAEGVPPVDTLIQKCPAPSMGQESMGASRCMRPRRMAMAAVVARDGLKSLLELKEPKFAPHMFYPTDIVGPSFFGALELSIRGTNEKFKDMIAQCIDSPSEQVATFIGPYAWMVAYDGKRTGNGTNITAALDAGIEAPFLTVTRSLLTHVIPTLWEQAHPNEPLEIEKLFEIAYAGTTGHILSLFAALTPRGLLRASYGISSPDEKGHEQLDPSAFSFDPERNAVFLRHDMLGEIERRGLEKIMADDVARTAYEQTPDVAAMGCVMNVSQRAFGDEFPHQTLMMGYYHTVFAMAQRGLYRKAEKESSS